MALDFVLLRKSLINRAREEAEIEWQEKPEERVPGKLPGLKA
jgi:hypothetical protein